LIKRRSWTAGWGGWRCCSRYIFVRSQRNFGSGWMLTSLPQMIFTQSLLYHLSTALVKISFTIQYLHLFSHLRSVTRTCYVLLALILGGAAWGVFGVIFLCRPIRSYWNLRVPGKCLDAETHFFSTSVVGIVLDWAVWIIPIPVVGRLNLPFRQKVGVVGVFGLGGLYVFPVSCYGRMAGTDRAQRMRG
jgi:hypothetical protein